MDIIAVVGPTATGKSSLGVEIAHALGGPDAVEIINADAYQLYKYMDIGTAKVTAEEQRGIRHHLLDVLDPIQDSSVAKFQEASREILDDISARGKRALVVGGSGLYVRAMLDDMNFPGTDPDVRSSYEAKAERYGTRAVYDELVEKDPAAAQSIGNRNERRIIRALEVIALTGKPYSANLPQQKYVRPTVTIGLDFARAALDERVALRVHTMIERGLIAEVKALMERGLGSTASRAVGYAEIIEHLTGDITLEDATEAIITNTRRLTRKQMGWFGRDPRITWLDGSAEDTLEQALGVIERHDQGLAPEISPEPVRRSLGS